MIDQKIATMESVLKHQPCGSNEVTQFEKIHTVVFKNPVEASENVAAEIGDLIRSKAEEGLPCVLGLATGSTPKSVYKELIRLHKEDGLSFKNVHTFNLDEYFGLQPYDMRSYHFFMHEQLFDNIDIPEENIHIPSGIVPEKEIVDYCRAYEQKIESLGGIDLQILGIGRTGHIGFNEPGSHVNSRTRRVTLDHLTISDAGPAFDGVENVPRKAITMGVGTIMNAKRVIIMAWGSSKASISQRAIEGEVSDLIPSTFLQHHDNTTFVMDEAASGELTRFKTPWLVGAANWSEAEIKKAVIWLSLKLGKPILKLTDENYAENEMSSLIDEHGPAYNINIKVFNRLQHTITGWPGGKPNADDTYRPERALPVSKRVVVFSPHPDDDAISMGGTVMRLLEQGHEVHIVNQTSGSNAVFDDDVIRYLQFFKDANQHFLLESDILEEKFNLMMDMLNKKKSGDEDSASIKLMKGLIRRGETKASARFSGVKEGNVHFLDMPFYQNKQNRNLTNEDIKSIIDILEKVRPHQVFLAGDLADPHGTHRICYDAILQALDVIRDKVWFGDCYVWMYRGAWQEWNVDQIEMAVPLSPDELMKKRKTIFKHQSQKDFVMFKGDDNREFWERSEARNRATANTYRKLGLAEYEAMEGFVKLNLEETD
ncbi:glucosamine-6-phosphate deaminase [Marinoscillum sp. MHG1-6]|uniref:glucosamine-6-phosphate deaminase n=1 Tax=Marinoscillum sp. MHG1-6 TaxID=2959627 RepID=UPI002157E177|nr:glucosamine-6-phosphate deaminase [Marinoscillum sp. MHG1-6]